MLEIQKANVRYGGVVALQDVSVEVRQGESVLLVGSNGAGKSSLINAVIGLVPLVSGRVSLEGKDLANVSCSDRSRLGLGYSPEGRRIFKSLTVRENVLSSTLGVPMREATANLKWLMATFPLLAERENQ